MKETDLAKYFIDYLSCYDLYFEVDYGRCVDIVAVADKFSIAVEVKTSFNFKVLEQAVGNKRLFNYSYIAVPDFKDDYFQKQLCEDYGVGLLLLKTKIDRRYDKDTDKIIEKEVFSVLEIVKPKLNRHASRNKLLPRLHEFSKTSIAGSKSGDGGKITAFGITIENLERYVSRNRGCTLAEAAKNISHHYGSNKAACANIYQWIRTGVVTCVKYENKKLYPVDEIENQKPPQNR